MVDLNSALSASINRNTVRRKSSIETFNDGNYHDSAHPYHLLSNLKIYFLIQKFTDQTMIVQGDTFRVHRAILAASSPFFDLLFSSSLYTIDPLQVEIHNIDKIIFTQILQYIYTGEIKLTDLNVEDLLIASTFLLMHSLTQYCEKFIIRFVDSSNCLGIMHLADRLCCMEILDYTLHYLTDNFMDICEFSEFLLLPLSDLIHIVRMEGLVVQNELQVLESCLKWYCFNKKARLKDMNYIFSHLKLPLIHLQDVKVCLSNFPEILTQNDMLIKELELYTFQPHKIAQDDLNAFRYIPRRSTCIHSVMYIVGGEINPGRITASTVQKYDLFKRQWEVCASMGSSRRGAGVSMARGQLFVVGGSDGYEALASCECYDPQLNRWRSITPMNKVSINLLNSEKYYFSELL